MLDLPTRRPCVTKEVGMGLSVTVSYHPKTGQPISFFYLNGAKPDNPMQEAYITLCYSFFVCKQSLYRTKKTVIRLLF